MAWPKLLLATCVLVVPPLLYGGSSVASWESGAGNSSAFGLLIPFALLGGGLYLFMLYLTFGEAEEKVGGCAAGGGADRRGGEGGRYA